MTEPILVGLDAGGTRTNVEAQIAGTRDPLFRYEVGDILSSGVHHSDYVGVLRKMLAQLEGHWQDNDLESRSACLFLSSAGFTAASRDNYLGALREVAPKALGGSVTAFGAANDAVTLLLGHRCDGVVIAGTGSNVLVRSEDRHLHQSCGHGWVASDEGSGFWIGLQAIRQACRDLDEDPGSVILLRLKRHYSIREKDSHGPEQLIAKFADLCVADEGMVGEIARFASSVCDAAERGDRKAQDIVKCEAERLADNAARAIRRHFSPERQAEGLSLIECGGLVSNDFYRSAFEAQVEMRLLSGAAQPAEISWKKVGTGVAAAINLARELAEQENDLMDVDLTFRPVIVRPSRS